MRYFLPICVFLGFHAFSQENNANVFTLKPSLGLNGCQVHGDTYSGYDKLGLFGGMAVNARINDKTSFELGFYFSQKGSRRNPTKDNPTYYRLHLNYLDLPLSLRYHVNPKYFITLGPSVAYLINHKEDENYVDRTNAYIYNRVEVGVNFGLGRIIKDRFTVEVRTSNSVIPIRTIPNNYVGYNNPVARFFNKGFYNNIISLFFTYKLDLRKRHAE